MYEIKYREDNEMKDSGIEWLGKIPLQWKVSKMKYFYKFGMGQTILKEDLNEIGVPVYSATEEDNYFGYIKNPKVRLIDGDIVIPARGNSIGSVKMVHEEATCTQTTIYGKKHYDSSKRFDYYFLKGLKKYLFNFDQTAIPQITTKQVSNNYFLEISDNEQQKIASFLDIKTTEFDKIITKKEQLIQKLEEAKKSLISEVVTGKVKIVDGKLIARDETEMKDSNTMYGLVPMNWVVTRLKFIASIKARIGWKGLKADEYVDKGYFFLATPNIKGKNIDFEKVNYINRNRYNESPEIKLKQGDVLLTKDGSTLGTANVIRKLDKEGTVNSSIAILRMRYEVNPILIYYFILSREMQDKINQMKDGMGVPHLFQRDIKEFELLIPSDEESIKIVDFLDSEIDYIEQIIVKVKLQIQKLKQAKQSLISEAVTGKIDLRDWEIIEKGE